MFAQPCSLLLADNKGTHDTEQRGVHLDPYMDPDLDLDLSMTLALYMALYLITNMDSPLTSGRETNFGRAPCMLCLHPL